jgi:hypothetical protein
MIKAIRVRVRTMNVAIFKILSSNIYAEQYETYAATINITIIITRRVYLCIGEKPPYLFRLLETGQL